MNFQIEHDKWIDDHLKRRQGERLDALKRGHGYGNQLFVKKIWWELTRSFKCLHPEYEIKDWRGRSYYIDFMWNPGSLRIAFEIMDFGSHGMDRTKYRLDLNRQSYLQSQDCQVISISLDELKANPDFIKSTLKHILAPYFAAFYSHPKSSFSKFERELMRAANRHNRLIRPAAAARELDTYPATVIRHCRELVLKGKFRPIMRGESGRVTQYEFIGPLNDPDLY